MTVSYNRYMSKNAFNTDFGRVAALYDKARPKYPKELIEKIISYSSLSKNHKILEVGVGTGQISLPFLELGFDLLGLEPDLNLCKFCQQKLHNYPNLIIKNQSFEDYQLNENNFNLFLSAQAFHWIEANFGLDKAIYSLKENGTIVLVWHTEQSQNTEFYKATTPVFARYISNEPSRPKPPSSKKEYKSLMQSSKNLYDFEEYSFEWHKEYSKQEFIDLLNTFSGHISLDKQTRNNFNSEIEAVIDGFGGRVIRLYSSQILLAKKS